MNDTKEMKAKLKESLDLNNLMKGTKFGLAFHGMGAALLALTIWFGVEGQWPAMFGWGYSLVLWMLTGILTKLHRVRSIQATLLLQLLDNVEIVEDATEAEHRSVH